MSAADIAAQAQAQIISNAIEMANQMAAASVAAGNQAITATEGIYYADPLPVQFSRPSVSEPNGLSNPSSIALLQGETQSLGDYYSSQLAGIFTATYDKLFLDGDAYPSATEWLMRVINVGGTGLNPDVERRIWLRDRNRISDEADRLADEAVRDAAGRGWSLPQGVTVAQVTRIKQGAQDKIADASNAVAIKVAEIELENIRFAVGKALELRMQAFGHALEYMRAMMLGPELALKLGTSAEELRLRFIAEHLDYQKAQLQAAQLDLQAKTSNSSIAAQLAGANVAGFAHIMNARATAAAAAAAAAGHQGAAALSSLSSGAHLNVSASQ